jgi:uncharacterized protein YjiS (DUF1127 family)
MTTSAQVANGLLRFVRVLLALQPAVRRQTRIDFSALPDELLRDCGFDREEIGPITRLRRQAHDQYSDAPEA